MKFLKRLYEIVFSKLSMGLIAIASLVLAIYYGNFYEKKPEIRYEIISNNSVLDVHEKLGKLDILYGGVSLKKQNQGLRIITFRVVNTGNADLLKGDYDEDAPLGFSLTSGEILEKPELKTDDAYLANNLKITLSNSRRATFSPVIFESNQSFEIKILVLISESEIPRLVSIGKVAGVKKIEVVYANKEDKVDVLTKIKNGLLFFIKWYFLLAIFIVLPFVVIKEITDKKKRMKLVAKFKIEHSYKNLTTCQNYILESFVSHGREMFTRLSRFQETYDKIRALIRSPKMSDLLEILKERRDVVFIDELRINECLHILDTDVLIEEKMSRIVEDLSQFLSNEGYLKKEI